MCLIIYKPKGAKGVNLEHIIRGYKYNRNGIGIYYHDSNNRFHTKFVPKDIDIVLNFFCSSKSFFLEHQENCEYVIHFRAPGHNRSQENCHPFEIGEDWLLFHNGYIQGYGSGNRSDTFEYAETLKGALEGEITNLSNKNELGGMIQSGNNKFVLCRLSGDNKTIVVDPSNTGVWKDGVWFSNKGVFK